MPFEFAFLDWLYQFRNPVMNAISIFFDYAGAHGEIWIAFTLLLLLFRRTRRAGFAMAVALVLYMAAGHFFLKPLFARPRPCDLNTSITMLVARPHGHSFPSGHTASGVAAAYALWLQNRKLGAPALVLAAFIAFTRLYLYVHFPTDVLGGAVLGIALGTAASAIANYMANCKKKQQKAENEKRVMLAVLDAGLSVCNVIYYDHSNELVFNWKDYETKVTENDFNKFVSSVNRSLLPAGITFKMK